VFDATTTFPFHIIVVLVMLVIEASSSEDLDSQNKGNSTQCVLDRIKNDCGNCLKDISVIKIRKGMNEQEILSL
jgi:hypothetical protein